MADNHFKIHKGATLNPQTTEPANPTDGDMYYDSTLNVFRVFENGSFVNMRSGGASAINYIDNPDAEVDTSGWATYADAAGTDPVDGTGGAANITFTRNTSSPLRGSGDFDISKSAADRQGEGLGNNFSIDAADNGQTIFISFDYNVSANFADGDIGIFIYDVTNDTLTRPTNIDILASSKKFVSSFIADTTSTSYRLIFHIASTNALAWDFNFDNVIVGPGTLAISDSFDTQEIFHIADHDTLIDRTNEIEFDISNVTFTGPEIITPADDSGSTRTTFTANRKCIADIFFMGRLTATTNDCRIFKNGSLHFQGGGRDNDTRGLVSAAIILEKDDFITIDVTGGGLRTEALPCSLIINAIAINSTEGSSLAQLPISNRTSFTPVITGAGTISNSSGHFKIIGDEMYVQAKWQSGTATGATWEFEIPNGHNIDYGKLSTSQDQMVGDFIRFGGAVPGASFGEFPLFTDGSTADKIFVATTSSTTIFTKAVGTTLGSDNVNTVSFVVPIEGLSANLIRALPGGVAFLKHVETSGTDGGASTTTTYVKRTLNDLSGDTGFFSVASSVITIKTPGTYRARIHTLCNTAGGNARTRLRNTTDSTDAILGMSADLNSGVTSNAEVNAFGTFTTRTSNETFEIQTIVQTGTASNGFGVAITLGGDEQYVVMELEQL